MEPIKEEGLEAIRNLTKDNSVKIIKENDKFQFHCQQCGQCCMNREDIILNPFDVFNGAKYLGITPKEFLDKYTYTTLGSNSKIPIVLLKTDEKTGFCPLLKFDIKDGGKFKCTINPSKPSACSNHPIGIAWQKGSDGTTSHSYIQVQSCENSKKIPEEHTVKDWVKFYTDHIPEHNVAHDLQLCVHDYFIPKNFFLVCETIISLLVSREAQKQNLSEEEVLNMSSDKMADILNKDTLGESILGINMKYIETTINLCYADFDINKPFVEQAQKNLEKLREIYKKIGAFYDDISKHIADLMGVTVDELIKKIEGED